MKFLDADEVARCVDTLDVVAALHDAFVGLAKGSCIQPPQTAVTLPSDGGDAIYYPAVSVPGGVIGVTVSPFLASLEAAGAPPVTAYTLLLSAETGLPSLLCDSMPLIAARTGATTALAVSRLARETSRQLTVVGAGPIAESHIRFARQVRNWDAIVVHSRTIDRPSSAARREAISAQAPGVSFVSSLEAAVADADVVMLCTSSATPVLDPLSLSPGVLVTSVSTDGPNAHEVPPASLPSLDVYCDYREAAPRAAGEMVLAAQRHGWSAAGVIADLPELLCGASTPADGDRVRFFRSIGLGIEDVALAAALAP